ncbi:MAG: imidazoleglycerol-phosphate dehydratase HisB, partial [Alphaproteobacteria bacterium]|nr:imidazoleglycerol-phosphate dehydratase HisB [Alphaproteobacteria bacterium]
DECIDIIIRMLCVAGQDQIMVCPPTFGMYQVYAGVQGAETIKVPLKKSSGYQLDLENIAKNCSERTKLIFITSPNAPMGHKMEREDIVALCKARAGKSIVVVDEAYVEFSSAPDGLIPLLNDCSNMVILRTMSKAHALAGERIGCAIGNAEIIKRMQCIQAPYPLARSSVLAAMDAYSPNGLAQSGERIKFIAKERERMMKLLPSSKLIKEVFPSVTNFIMIRTTGSADFMGLLKKFGILARDRSGDIADTIRLTVGTPEENDLVLRAVGVDVEDNSKARTLRLFSVKRNTNETKIDVTVNLDAENFLNIDTGIGFFDHMLAQLAKHGGIGLEMHCKGDLGVDQHHTIEDCALALGEALKAALGDKRGIARFGFYAPLDEALAQAVVDISGRPYCEFNGAFAVPSAGEMSCEMVPHFFRSLATALGASIQITVKGDNAHHMIEACFKAVGRSLRQAFRLEGDAIPSTKGTL